MSKALEALEELKKKHFIDGRLPLIDKIRFELIEKELKEYKETKKELAQVMKDYQDLGQYIYQVKQALKSNLKCNIIFGSNDEKWSVFVENKDKRVEVASGNNKQEYDLLKEVLL